MSNCKYALFVLVLVAACALFPTNAQTTTTTSTGATAAGPVSTGTATTTAKTTSNTTSTLTSGTSTTAKATTGSPTSTTGTVLVPNLLVTLQIGVFGEYSNINATTLSTLDTQISTNLSLTANQLNISLSNSSVVPARKRAPTSFYIIVSIFVSGETAIRTLGAKFNSTSTNLTIVADAIRTGLVNTIASNNSAVAALLATRNITITTVKASSSLTFTASTSSTTNQAVSTTSAAIAPAPSKYMLFAAIVMGVVSFVCSLI